jgi:hypothetical protein
MPRGCCWPCHTASHSSGDGLTGGIGGAVPGRYSQARRGMDSPLTWAPANVSALNPPVGGAGMEAAGPRGPRARRNLAPGGVQLSIETVPRSRARPGPERGGVLLKGATGPRARWNLTRGGDRPSSEAELYRCGTLPLGRSGVPFEGG